MFVIWLFQLFNIIPKLYIHRNNIIDSMFEKQLKKFEFQKKKNKTPSLNLKYFTTNRLQFYFDGKQRRISDFDGIGTLKTFVLNEIFFSI